MTSIPKTHLLWLAGGSCEGCTMAVLGASAPKVEAFLSGNIRGVPELELVHATLSLDVGAAYLDYLYRAWQGELEPFILIVEGSIFNESLAGTGHFSSLGAEDGEPVTVANWLNRLAPKAEAVIAIGSCATWGGVPAAMGNVTGAMGLNQFLGDDYRSAGGLPVINVPGCAPHGDAFLELMTHVFLHLEGAVPLELDEQRRPRWLFQLKTHPHPPRADHIPAAAFEGVGTPDIGCPVPSRGWMNRIGGCGTVGGYCIGCTMPDFVDLYLPLARVDVQSNNHNDDNGREN